MSMNNVQMTDSKRMSFSFVISVFIHAMFICILILLFFRFDLGFKKGTSTDEMMKVAGFSIIGGGDSNDNIDTPDTAAPSLHNPTAKSRPNQNDIQSPDKSQDLKPSGSKESLDLSSLSLYQGRGQKPENHRPKSRVKALNKFPSVDNVTRRDVEELYGQEFGDYGFAEQEFIVNNLRDIGRITAQYLKYPPSAARLGQQGLSAVEFYLHPNGDISGLKIIVSSDFMLLDRNSERTIEIAYKDYPRPSTKTKIRIFVSYGIIYYGY